MRFAGQGRVVHLQAGGADLRGKSQLLVGEFVELAHRNSDLHVLVPSCAGWEHQPLTEPAVMPATMKRWATK